MPNLMGLQSYQETNRASADYEIPEEEEFIEYADKEFLDKLHEEPYEKYLQAFTEQWQAC